jgi:hypothetical protein
MSTITNKRVRSPHQLVREPRTLAAIAATVVTTLIVGLAIQDLGDDALRVITIFVPVIVTVVVVMERRWVLGVTALVATWLAALVVLKYFPHVFDPDPRVGEAVGGAAFSGTPYEGLQIAGVISVVMIAAVALAVAAREASRRRAVVDAEQTAGAKRLAFGWPAVPARPSKWLWICVAVLVFALIPDLRAYLRTSSQHVGYGWDVSNLTAWQGLVQMGLVPMKDFFYPYGFQWLYTLASYGPLIQWFAQGVMLTLAAWSLWRLTVGNIWQVLACLLAMLFVAYWGVSAATEAWRYLPALLIPLTYAAIGPGTHTRLGSEHAMFFAACLLAALVEADLLVTGVLGALLVLVGQFASGRIPRAPRRLVMGVALDALPVIGALILILLVWLATGTAAGNLRFFSGFSAVSALSAPNEQLYGVSGSLVLYPTTISVYAAIPALLAAAGFLSVRLKGGTAPAVGAILLGAAGVSWELVLKDFVRPQGDVILVAPLTALLWAVILSWKRSSVPRAAACGFAFAAVVIFVGRQGDVSVPRFVGTLVSSPARAARSVSVVFDPSARARAEKASTATKRFRGWPDQMIAYDYVTHVTTRPLPKFAVIGDSAETYVLLHQRPPWETDLYDTAPLSEQKTMLSKLRQSDPPYVIWRRDVYVDFVPYNVRDPLVFNWMVRNYVPVRTSGVVDILKRRQPDQVVPPSFWAGSLGTLQLGFIPSYSAAASSPSCVKGPGCVPYIMVSGHGSAATLQFSVSENGATFPVELQRRSGVNEYPVRADRLWFWPLVKTSPMIVSMTRGYTAREVGLRSGDNLY